MVLLYPQSRSRLEGKPSNMALSESYDMGLCGMVSPESSVHVAKFRPFIVHPMAAPHE